MSAATYRRAGAAALVLAALVLAALLTGLLTVRGWSDISVGTNTSYCGVYLPHLDFYCQAGR